MNSIFFVTGHVGTLARMSQARSTTREKWGQIIESQRASGQTAAAWCRDHHVAQASFFAWKRRLRTTAPAAEFVEIHAASETPPSRVDGVQDLSAAIEVCCRGGRRLLLRSGFDRALLREAVQALEGLP